MTVQLSDILVNGSELTRLYSLEQGLGYGRIRLSILFRPVEAKLPPNLRGFDTGILEVRDLSAKLSESDSIDLFKCQVRVKTTKCRSDEKFSCKNSEQHEDGTIVWKSDDMSLTRIPVRMRYGTAMVLSFKETSTASGVKHSGRKALAILWLRDISDNEEHMIELPLWTTTDGNYLRLKQNYIPPDGNFDTWDDEKRKVKRIGSVWVHIIFKPGISDLHHKQMDSGVRKKEAWEAYTREQQGGMRDSVGELGLDERNPARRPESLGEKHRGSDAYDTSQSSEHRSSCMNSHNLPSNDSQSVPSSSDSPAGYIADGSQQNVNTIVPFDAVETKEVATPEGSTDGEGEEDEDEDDSEKKKGVARRVQKWRQGEKDLHKDHRGIMQMKPARTAEWIKDNVEEGVHHMKDRFAMKARKPDIETEV